MKYTDAMAKKAVKKTEKLSKKSAAKNHDFEPGKMTFAIAALSAVTLALLAIIIVYS